MTAATSKIDVQRLAGAVGAEIRGVDLAGDYDDAFDDIHHAFLKHAVLVFRDQHLSPDAQLTFSNRFGGPEQHLLSDFALPDNPDVFVVSNVMDKGKPKGAIRAGQYWHSDCSYMPKPTQASVLHALEVPSYGGDTMFASMVQAYDLLSETMQDLLANLRAEHDYNYAYEQFFSRVAERPPLTDEQKARVPPVAHPIVRTHPETGAKALFVNPGFTRRIIGMSEEESRTILGFLFEHAKQPDLIYRHHWAKGDLIIWDNRSTWHLAVADYDMAEPRHMHRTSVQGDVPV